MAAIPAFSPQICAAELAELTPLPLVSLLDVIASETARRKLRRVAVFGARVTMETGLFGKLPDCDVIGLSREETNLVSDIYLRVIEAAKASAEEYEQLRSLAHSVIEREHLDAIVLAGPISPLYSTKKTPISRTWMVHVSTSGPSWTPFSARILPATRNSDLQPCSRQAPMFHL